MKNIVVILILLCSQIGTKAQSMAYTHYTVADKLPSNICYMIIQDEKGFIWVPTEKGIAIFDGYSFKPIRTKNKLLILDLWGLFKDNENRIWLKSKQNQYSFIYKDSVYNINANQTLQDSYVAIVNYGTSPLIIKSNENDNYIYVLDINQQLLKKNIPPLLKQKILTATRLDQLVFFNLTEKKMMLLFSTGEMFQYDFETNLTKTRIFNKPIKGLFPTKGTTDNIQNILYFAAGDSIFSIRNNQTRFVTTYAACGIHQEAIFVGICNHIYFYRLGKKLFTVDTLFRPVSFNFPMLQSTVSQIFEDKEHNLWFVTIGDGIYFVSNKTLQNKIYSKENGLLDNHILSLCMHKNSSLYLSYYSQDGFQYVKNDHVFTIPKNTGVGSNMLIIDQDDFLISDQYISKKPIQVKYNFSGIQSNQNKKKDYFVTQLNLGLKSVCKINDQQVLVGTKNSLLRISKKNNTLFIDSLITTNAYIYAIAVIDKTILLGTPEGLYLFENNKLHYVDKSYQNLQGNIRAILVDLDKKIWITSDNANLNCYDASLKLVASFPAINGLVTSLYLDTIDQTILASSSNGLYAIEMKYPHKYSYYSVAEGLPSNEVNATVSDKDYFYVATSSGLGILKKKIENFTYKPKLYCTKSYINNIEKTLTQYEELNYTQNNIRFELSTLSYQSLGKIKYYYRLHESDKTWAITNQPIIEFSSLKPGKYQLEIFAKDVNDNPTENKLRINFSIEPPFWKTTWFYVLVTLLFFAAFFIGLYMWLQRGKRKALHEVNIKKEFAEIKLIALQSQLNSHFIYNSLNAIQNFILNKDEITASEYMNKFAKLIRLFLESSRSQLAPLQKEIELITIYTSLEKLRFDDKFDVVISTDKIIDKQTSFPTSMVQPFVENAIIHGLLHNQTKGLLAITFLETEQEIACVIEDNGIGRAKSIELNKSRKRKSIGMDIIQDKIINIDNLHEKRISLDIIDKNIETHSSTGTIVNIRYKK